MRARFVLALAVVSGVLGLAAACSGGPATSPPAQPDARSSDVSSPSDASDAPVGPPETGSPLDAGLDASTDLVPPGFTKIVVTVAGGYNTKGGDGSNCWVPDETFTLDVAAATFTWRTCETTDGGLTLFTDGSRAVTNADLAPVMTALHGLRRSTQTSCGYDKPVEQITFTVPTGAVILDDSFYACQPTAGTRVDGIDPAIAAFAELAR
jgi:hypothetical protein